MRGRCWPVCRVRARDTSRLASERRPSNGFAGKFERENYPMIFVLSLSWPLLRLASPPSSRRPIRSGPEGPDEAKQQVREVGERNGQGRAALYVRDRGRRVYAAWDKTAAEYGKLFPDNSKEGGNTRAKAAIWQNRKDFDAKIATFSKAVAEGKAEGELSTA